MVGAAAEPRLWQRRSPRERLIRFLAWLGVVAAAVWSIQTIDIFWPWVWDAPAEVSDLAVRMWPPEVSNLDVILRALFETVHIATISTALTVFLALPVSYIAAQNTTPNRALLWLGRMILVSSRSVNTLIWALLFVAIFGPGIMAGILAIMFRSIGFVGKLVGEAIEEIDRRPVEAMASTGASQSKVVVYAIVPQVMATFVAVIVLRWDINIRESTVLGLVGAGGIGMILQSAIDTFAWPEAATVLIAIIVLVLIGETVSGWLRSKVI